MKSSKKIFYRIFFLVIVLFLSGNLFAQDTTATEKPYTKGTFKNGGLVTVPTTEMLYPKTFEFKVQHRFGVISNGVSDFFGWDATANIRLGLTFSVMKNLQVGIGRTKFNKDVDFNGKYKLLKQTPDNRTPVSIAIYHETDLSTVPTSQLDSVYNDFEYRVNYFTQIIIARKFSERLSLQISPTFIHKNLVVYERSNDTYTAAVSGRFKFTNRTSAIFEFVPLIQNKVSGVNHLISLGVEFETGGHVFQLFFSSSQDIPGQRAIPDTPNSFFKGDMVFGFNLTRLIWTKRPY